MHGQKKETASIHDFCQSPGMKTLDWAGKSVAWYCLTGPQTQKSGLFVLDADQACQDLGTTRDVWDFYLELVADELGWRWDAQRGLLWITDYFRWIKVTKSELLASLKSLPETPWLEEFKAVPPAQLSSSLQAAWKQWFFPVPPAPPTAEEIALASIREFSQLTPELIPLAARRYLRRNTPAYIIQEFECFLRVRSDFLDKISTPETPSPNQAEFTSPSRTGTNATLSRV